MSPKYFTISLLLGLLACQTGSQKSDSQVITDSLTIQTEITENQKFFAKAELNEGAKTLAKGNNDFAFALYQALAAEKLAENQNLFFSPLSIYTALGMVYAGAAGKTEKEMQASLHFKGGFEKIKPDFFNLIGHFNQQNRDTSTYLNIANSIWVDNQPDFKVNPNYVKDLQQNFNSEPYIADLQKPETVEKINAWVKQKTRNKIAEIAKDFGDDIRLVLFNAIYFKSNWQNTFEAGASTPEDFTLVDAKKVKTTMMFQMNSFNYFENPSLQILELPYQNENLSMLVVLPRNPQGLAQIERNFLILNELISNLQSAEVRVKLPKFKVNYEKSLVKILEKLHLESLFKETDLSKMSNVVLSIGDVFHKTFIEVNESGTEAAAVTMIEAKTESAPPQPEQLKEFIADHPFLYLIREKQSGAIVFMGRILNPKGDE